MRAKALLAVEDLPNGGLETGAWHTSYSCQSDKSSRPCWCVQQKKSGRRVDSDKEVPAKNVKDAARVSSATLCLLLYGLNPQDLNTRTHFVRCADCSRQGGEGHRQSQVSCGRPHLSLTRAHNQLWRACCPRDSCCILDIGVRFPSTACTGPVKAP